MNWWNEGWYRDIAMTGIKIEDTTVNNILGGAFRSFSINPSSKIRIDSDMDIFLKLSGESDLYGGRCKNNGIDQAWRTTAPNAGGPAMSVTMAGLDFAANSFSVESWFSADTVSDAADRIIHVGGDASDPKISVRLKVVSSKVQTKFELDSDDGISRINSSYIEHSDIPVGLEYLHHLVLNIDRTNSKLYTYMNGAQVAVQDFTPFVEECNMTNIAVNYGTIGLGASVSAAMYNGLISDIRFYTSLLTITEIQSRNERGPLSLPSDGTTSCWRVSFNTKDSWSNPLYPEADPGQAVFDHLLGSPTIDLFSGGALAVTNSNPRIYAAQPTILKAGGSDSFINVYSCPASSGNIRITKVT